tara:strand:- start:1987 stop:3012 length:1026 start_codon:yes stop_codon:yes gene_type:complete
MHIAYIVCPNGLGHLRRTLTIVDELLKRKKFRVTIFAEINYYSSKLLNKKMTIKENLKVEDIKLPHPVYNLNDFNYDSKIKEFKNKLSNYDLIFSDNLIYPVAECSFERVIFVSQFFWHNVKTDYKNKAKNKELIQLEEEIINQEKPLIFGSGIFAMEELRNLDKFFPINNIRHPFFQKKRIPNSQEYLLITDGTTSASSEFLNSKLSCIEYFCKENNLKLFISPRLDKNKLSSEFEIFDYSYSSFSKVLAGICRPGLGVLTDLIFSSSIPIPLFLEDNNELLFNKNVIDKFFGFENNDITLILKNVINKKVRLSQIASNFEFNGEEQIIKYIEKEFNLLN